MNIIPVIAHGCPNSFMRHVQHNPQLALDLALTLAQVRRWMLEESVKVPPKMMARIDEVLDFDALLRRPKRAGDN